MNVAARIARSILYRVGHLSSHLERWAANQTYLKVRAKCAKEFHGSSDYGGWFVCPDGLGPETVVYSFGVGEDIEFDLSLIRKYGLTVHAFDPTPRSIRWVKARQMPPRFILHEYGLADYDGTARFFPPANPEHVSHTLLERSDAAKPAIEVPVRRLATIVQELGHSRIGVLKMDIEGAEYAVIDDIIRSGIEIGQVLVEFHHRFRNVGEARTRRAVRSLIQAGFRVFDVSPSREDISFIRLERLSRLGRGR